MIILISILCFLLGGLCAWYYMDGRLAAMRNKAKFFQESRLRLISAQEKMFVKLLEDIEEMKK